MLSCGLILPVFAFGVPLPPTGDTYALSLPVSTNRVNVQRLSDHHCFLLIMRPAPQNAGDEIKAQLECLDIDVVHLPRRGVEVRICFPLPIVDLRLSAAGSGAIARLRYLTPEQSTQQRIKTRIPRSVPTTYTAPRFLAAEQALVQGQLGEAKRRFKKLEEEYSLKPWAQVRGGDITLLAGQTREACRRYQEVIDAYPTRTAGTIAHLRASILACGDPKKSRARWPAVFARLRYLSGNVGAYLQQEATWALGESRTPDEIAFALDLIGDGPAGKVAPLQRLLVAKAIRFAPSPWERASFYLRFRNVVESHPEVNDLTMRVAESLLALDLPEEAADLLQRLEAKANVGRGTWADRSGPAQWMTLLANAHDAANNDDLAWRYRQRFRKRFGQNPPAENTELEPIAAESPVHQRLILIENRLVQLRWAANVSTASFSGVRP